MTHGPTSRQVAEEAALPFGSDPARPRTPLVVFSLLYLAWFGVLVCLAIDQYARR